MFFKSREDVKEFCNSKGYFIAKDTNGSVLAVKKSDNEFQRLPEEVKTNEGRALSMTVLKHQLENFIINPLLYLDNTNDWITVVDINLYRLYDERKEVIELHKAVLKDIKVKKGIFGTASKLIAGHTGGKHPEPCYFLVKDGKLEMVSASLIDDPQDVCKFSASQVRRALKDNLENEYEGAYKQAIEEWEKVKVQRS